MGRLPAVAGEEQDLARLRLLPQEVQGGGAAGVVKAGQGVVQDDGDGVFGRQDQIADGQAHGKIELVRRPGGEAAHVPGHAGACGLRRDPEGLVQNHAAVGSAGEAVENLGGALPQGGGEAALKLGIGVGQGGHGQLDGGVFPL